MPPTLQGQQPSLHPPHQMWLRDNIMWHRLALGMCLVEAYGSRPGAVKGPKYWVLAPCGEQHTVGGGQGTGGTLS